jgi:asparagine synthase (glutamine-hydrolysing)
MTLPVPHDDELLVNLLLGAHHGAPPPPAWDGSTVRDALERAMLRALQREPCVVSFSGGRDSSAVLSVAVDVARRHGLPDPLPVTMRFPDAPQSDETEWQQLVLTHLGVREHEVLELRDEIDALGPLATAMLAEHGLVWPANAYMHGPVFDVARGGAVLTGVGGDELFGTRASPHVRVLHRRERPSLAAARSLAGAALPRAVVVALRRRRVPPIGPWLRPAAARRVATALAEEEARWPSRWDRSLDHWLTTRAFASASRALPALGEAWRVEVTNPFLEAGVLAALRAAGGPPGFDSRTAAMATLFGDLLPRELVARPAKAVFSAPLWGPGARAFAKAWSGQGLDPDDVDVDVLRANWSSPAPTFTTILLLHRAWMHDQEASSVASS